MKRAILGLFTFCMVYGQTPDPTITFEVASVKALPPRTVRTNSPVLGCSGGPGTSDPGRFSCTAATVEMLLRQAFDLKTYQMPASKSESGRFFSFSGGEVSLPAGIDIAAKAPAGATREQFQTMLQNLLIERFKLTYHWEKKDGDVYDLVVAKNGPKMKESPPDSAPSSEDAAPPPNTSPARPELGPNGCPVLGARHRAVSLTVMIPPRVCVAGTDAPIGQLVKFLNSFVGLAATDATGLKGNYDISLAFARDVLEPGAEGRPAPMTASGVEFGSGATIFAALQDQLGLRLEEKKGSIDLFVVDHVEKVPTEN